MEEDCEVFMDPEEDEIFFGNVPNKEVNVTEKIMKMEPTSEIDIHVNNEKSGKIHVENITGFLLNRDEEKENVTVKIEDEKVGIIKSENDYLLEGNTDSGTQSMCKGILEDIVENISVKEIVSTKSESPAPMIKFETPNKSSPNVQLDHNYSTPVRSIIDKSILATPKSVVKADKDGGFLKVLSEIAIVKAEADIEKSLIKEDEDKENKNLNVSLKVPEVKITEATPDKISNSPSPKKLNQETRKFRLVYNTPEKVDNLKDDSPPAVLPEIKEENKENVSEPVNDLKTKLENMDFLQKNLEELENKIKKEESVMVKKNTPEKINLSDEILINSDVPEIDLTNSASKCVNTKNELKAEIEEITLDSSPVVKSEEICEVIDISSNSDVQILDVTAEEKSTFEKPNFRMSEEARKVLEILNKKSPDDSLNFTVQEIDVDKTHIPFDSPEISDLLNDSIPRPTAKQTELLREILSATPKDKTSPIPFKTPVNAKVTSVKKFVVSQEKQKLMATPLILKKTPSNNTKINSVYKTGGKEAGLSAVGRWNPVDKSASSKKCVKRLNVDEIKTPTPLSAGSVRWNPVDRSGSTKKCVKRLNVDENFGKGDEGRKDVQNNEKEAKAPGTSKIPKFGQFSKIPVTGKKIVFPGANKGSPVRTPKPAAFAKIESPVNAYIHNKPTPLIKNIKPEIKKDSAKKVWMKQAAGSAKKINSEEQAQKADPNRCKTALPFVEYRSATPLKFEKNIESKLPRLAPTMKKLITTNSPQVLKHEGRIHLNLPRKVAPVSTVDNSLMVDPNEVSVVVSHVAQKSNTISK